MPSPFPGMDPYLEQPDVFPGLHDRLIAYLSEALQPLLPAPYFADLGRRAWIEVSERPLVIRVPHDERQEPFVEIYAGRGKQRRLVTSIEVLSPSNKQPGEDGRNLYLRKQRELLRSKVHVVEIDLLRGGEHTTAVPHDRLLAEAGSFDYHICVHRFDNLEDFFVYPVRLPESLPVVNIPLLPGDESVAVDLQTVFTRSYDTGPYAREIDYRHDRPVPPLTPKQSRWAKQCLVKAGIGSR